MVVPLKDEKGIAIIHTFQEILNDSARISNKLWADKGSESYNRPMKSWYQDIDTGMYATYNEGKFVVAGKFGRTLKEQKVDFNNNNNNNNNNDNNNNNNNNLVDIVN